MNREATPTPRWYEALGVAVTIIAAVVLAFVLWQVIKLNRQVGADAAHLQNEQLAVHVSNRIVDAMETVAAYRHAAALGSSPKVIDALRQQSERQLTELNAEFSNGQASSLGVQQRWDSVESASRTAFAAQPGQGAFAPIDVLMGRLKDVLGALEDKSGLTYDPNQSAQNLADVALLEMPYAFDAVTRSRDEADESTLKHMTLIERMNLGTDLDTMKAVFDMSPDNLPGIANDLSVLLPGDASQFAQLPLLAQGVESSGGAYRTLLERWALMKSETIAQRQKSDAEAAWTVERVLRMRAAAAEALNESLMQRSEMQELRSRYIYVALVIGALVIGGIMMTLTQMVSARGRRALRQAKEESARLSAELSRQRVEEALRLSEAQFRAVFDGAALGIALVDRNGVLVDANGVFRLLFGESPTEALRGHEAEFAELWDGRRDTFEFEQHAVSPTGDEIWTDTTVSVVTGQTGAPLFAICTFRDLTELKRNERRMLHDKMHDALTGLPNRHFFEEQVRKRFAEASVLLDSFFAVIVVDLEHFKDVNESLGHSAGDFVLTQVAQRLSAEVDSNDIVARLGSDEFAILIHSLGDILHVETVARRTLNSLSKVIDVSQRSVFLGASVGVAIGSATYESAEDILRDAEIAMQHAKVSGGARYSLFDSKMHARTQKRLRLTSDLRLAIERNEFRLLYQPIVDINGGRIVGCEALLRWDHPVDGVLNPAHFIPLAEQTGIATPIGRYVLEGVADQLVEWRRTTGSELDFGVNVNISATELLDPEFEHVLVDIVERHDLSPSNFMLEITENIILESGTRANSAIERVRDRGFAICIDDFGTGYSSLRYLQEFKVDTIKIDRSFVNGVDGELASEPIVRTLLTLAESYGVRVVAEGVETTRQRDLLRGVGCRFVQGFLYARPLSPTEMIRLYPGILAARDRSATA